MKGKGNLLVIVLVLIVAAASASVFTVDERQYAIKLRFGEIIRDDYTPGLNFKVPLVHTVVKYEDRILTENNPTEEFLTQEKKNLKVDFYVKWRITDPGQYYQAVGGDERIATNRLIEIIKDGIRAEFAKRTVQQVVTADRREIMDDMMVTAGQTARELGIEVVDVRVKRLDLPDEVSDSVFNRMRQERARVAAQLRAEGAEKAEQIRAEADRDRTIILAEAYKKSEEIRGAGDAEAASIYAGAHEKNAEFYSFYRSLEAYRRSLGASGDIFVLGPESEYFQYMREAQPAAGK